MRVGQLLALQAICLLGVACTPVEQPVGELIAESNLPQPGGVVGGPKVPSSRPDVDAGPMESEGPPNGGSGAGGSSGLGRSNGQSPSTPSEGSAEFLPDDPNDCTDGVIAPERRRLDMYIMMDSYITLPGIGAWELVASGLNMFAERSTPGPVGVGIRYFGFECASEPYENADVDVELLPDNAPAILRSTAGRRFSASPMLPALEGGIAHARSRAIEYPDWKQVVVLISDGFSQDFTCPYTTDDLQRAAAEGFIGAPSVETHVVGIGAGANVNTTIEELIERFGAFDDIALAGGSAGALTVERTDDPVQFSQALDAVRRRAQPCEFQAPEGVPADQFGLWRYSLADQVPRVANNERCGVEQGWYYDRRAAPYAVTLCPATCAWLRERDEHELRYLLGCAATTRN